MTASRSPSPSTQELENLVAELSLQPDREPVVSELGVLQSIYGDNAIRMWRGDLREHPSSHGPTSGTIRYEVHLNLPDPYEDVTLKILVSLPPSYPVTSPPQLQLLSRYIGAFGVDADLFGSILRTFISLNGVEWIADTVCVFDGLQNVIERCAAWYEKRLSLERAGELLREDEKEQTETRPKSPLVEVNDERTNVSPSTSGMPGGIEIVEADAIVDRKSVFIGRACRISHPSEVPLILSHLMSDRRISRAAHPIINAWRCQAGTLIHQDNDDDGESAAGGRLAHLLQILEVNNVLVIVTRYFGGIHLGPDRFKHINQAARNALELGGFLDETTKKHTGRAKKR